MDRVKLYKERANLRTILIGVLIGLFGVLLVVIATTTDWLIAHPGFQTPIRELGGILFATVTVALLWELYAKRAFLAEVMTAANIAEDVRAARLLNITNNFVRGIHWDEFFRRANNLTIFFSYGNPWRDYGEELRNLAARHNTRVQLMLPDPNDEKVMIELSRRFDETPEEVKHGIVKTEREFKDLFDVVKASTQFSIWYLSFAPVFSYYIFDEVVVLTLYKHRRERVAIPAFVFEKGGQLYDFIKAEHEAIIKESNHLAKQVFP